MFRGIFGGNALILRILTRSDGQQRKALFTITRKNINLLSQLKVKCKKQERFSCNNDEIWTEMQVLIKKQSKPSDRRR